MRRSWGAVVLLIALSLAAPAGAQSDAEIVALDAEVKRLFRAGRYEEALPRAERLLGTVERVFGPNDANVGAALDILASIHRFRGDLADAERAYMRSLAIAEKSFGARHEHVATSLNNLAGLRREQGRPAEAEALYKRTLAIREAVKGRDDDSVGEVLSNLGIIYRAMGRGAEAEALHRRALAIRARSLGPSHPGVALVLDNLGVLLMSLGRHGEAEPLLTRALAIRERTLAPGHPQLALSLNHLAGLLVHLGRHAEAEEFAQRGLSAMQQALGRDHAQVGTLLFMLATVYRAQGRLDEAALLCEQALANAERALGPEHPHLGQPLDCLARLALMRRDWQGAIEHWRRSTLLMQRRAGRGMLEATADPAHGEPARLGWQFLGLARALWHQSLDAGDRRAAAIGAFETAQWAMSSAAARSLAQMSARGAAAAPGLAAIVRERQDLVAEWQAKDRLLLASRTGPQAHRDAAAERRLAARLAGIDTRLVEIDRRLAREHPDHAVHATPAPVAVGDVQRTLRGDEALVLVVDAPALDTLPEETLVWIVTSGEVRWLRSDLGTTALAEHVAALRCGLDAAAWRDDGAQRCAGLFGRAAADPAPDPLPFDAARAHALYARLLGGAEDLIAGKHLLLVTSASLARLPPQVLVTAPAAAAAPAGGGGTAWLARRHAVTVLPAVSSLTALRRTGRPSRAAKPMIGFANPLLEGDQHHPQHGAYYRERAELAVRRTGCAPTAARVTPARRGTRGSIEPLGQRDGLTDQNRLRSHTPLPETADEVCAVARALGADPSAIRLGTRAAEAEVKRMSASGELRHYRIVHFATHGTLAGELHPTSEPGLLLTPPAVASANDDGYLAASEIAALRLDADWVILSACNTAAGATREADSEALSGLARAFFYAGSRALLVSHWAVDSEAAVSLVTTALAASTRDAGIGPAEALRRAMLALADDPATAHPAYWAPFVIVGEDGRRRGSQE